MIVLELITGFSVGIEFLFRDEIDENGYVVIDLGVLRVMYIY